MKQQGFMFASDGGKVAAHSASPYFTRLKGQGEKRKEVGVKGLGRKQGRKEVLFVSCLSCQSTAAVGEGDEIKDRACMARFSLLSLRLCAVFSERFSQTRVVQMKEGKTGRKNIKHEGNRQGQDWSRRSTGRPIIGCPCCR